MISKVRPVNNVAKSELSVGCGEADEYDRLIQMCDALATDYGFVILEKRFVVNFFLENLLTLYRPCVSINFAPQKPQFFGGEKI